MIKDRVERRWMVARLLAGAALVAPIIAVTTKAAKAANILFENTLFLSGATGATTKRTPAQRCADIFNVLDFGADPTGVADSQPAIARAITAAANNGIIFFPKGTYKVNSAILIPGGSSLIFRGVGNGSFVTGNFNGFVFDNLSSPYNAQGGISVIEQLSISNSFTGNNFNVTANGTWSASGSPVNITLSGSNPGVVTGGALYISDSNFATNAVFVGMITSVASWPTITVASAAVASGVHSNLALRVTQAYPAAASWTMASTSITMSSTPPAGISGQYYVWDYERILSDPKEYVTVGVATWSGTTLTFTPGTTASVPSVGSTDRLWLAPVAGCVRYSSAVGATVRDCTISGFIGVTSSEDKIVPNDPTVGAAQGFNITVERCIFSNPAGYQGVPGQTGCYLQNNSAVKYSRFTACWVGIRISGGAVSIIGGQAETNYFAILIGGDSTGTIGQVSDAQISTISMESNALAIYTVGAGTTNINAIGILNNFPYALGGLYLSGAGNTVIQNSAVGGNYFSNYAIYIVDAGNSRPNVAFICCSANNANNANLSWRIPAQAWWGTCTQCDNPALEYTFANLPSGVSSPTPVQGETYDISDCNTATFLATAAAGGAGAVAHRRVKYNATAAVWQVVG